ncbi:hypothetical protein [Flavivirga eckloniae]|uniref:Uncharacterized protein n=1 Tax=Flavivirga eckloniae TaxID=1803846 RepID=A0A2K9PRN6_9FLAO|nr:hypothetical protein [Flavivirga eckloniae]AUP79237.1 hypothetical protein C1H87_11185 [Flavivirga eckloniae]
MNNFYQNVKLTKTFLVLVLSLTISCSNEPKKIPLESVDKTLKMAGDRIANDIIVSMKNGSGAYYLLKKGYVAPILHGRIMRYGNMYKEAYEMASMVIGDISDPKLFQVVNKGVVKSLSYKLKSTDENVKFIELKININNKLGLADYFLYVTTKDGILNKQNILPKR